MSRAWAVKMELVSGTTGRHLREGQCTINGQVKSHRLPRKVTLCEVAARPPLLRERYTLVPDKSVIVHVGVLVQQMPVDVITRSASQRAE